MSTFQNISDEVAHELDRARQKFPDWPHDMIHGAAIVVEEAGELQQAALQAAYEFGQRANVRKEAVHAAAMAIRFLMNFDRMNNQAAQQFKD